MPTIEIRKGPGVGSVFTVEGDSAIIGREAGCAVRIVDGRVSRAHAEIQREGPDRYRIRDRGSSNGTVLNGRRIDGWETLPDDAEIILGGIVLRFSLRGKVLQPTAKTTEDAETILQVMETQELPPMSNQGRGPDGAVGALRFLLDLARAAEESASLEELSEVLAEGLGPAIEADRVILFHGRDEEMTPVARRLPPHLERIYGQPYSTSIVRRVARERVAVLSRLTEDERFKDAASVAKSAIHTAICVPLMVGKELLGALYLDRLDAAEDFTASNLELATAAGVQCGMALLNIRRLTELRHSRDELVVELTGPSGFVGQSDALTQVYDFIERVAPTDAGVLILGESGTGKELVARAIHRNSPRVDRPFVIVNCAALAESLAEAELFGHERGAFTGADKSRPGRFLAADGGTIFLDEVGELSEPIQAKLLRVLESGEITPVGEAGARHIDVRVVAATNRDLEQEVEAGGFRRDLYYRLNILAVELPPLRERGEDIKLLIEHFIQFFGDRLHRPGLGMSREAMKRCLAYPWPGNVRELKNAVERMVILAREDEVSEKDLPPSMSSGRASTVAVAAADPTRSLAQVERDHIQAVLEYTDGNKKKAAEILQIDRSTLYSKIKSYDIG